MFDPESKRIGCVLLQAAYGHGENNWLVHRFNTSAWITGEGADKLRAFKATVGQWEQCADICNHAHREAA